MVQEQRAPRQVASPHMVDYAPFIKSQLASRSQLQGLMWSKFGYVPRGF